MIYTDFCSQFEIHQRATSEVIKLVSRANIFNSISLISGSAFTYTQNLLYKSDNYIVEFSDQFILSLCDLEANSANRLRASLANNANVIQLVDIRDIDYLQSLGRQIFDGSPDSHSSLGYKGTLVSEGFPIDLSLALKSSSVQFGDKKSMQFCKWAAFFYVLLLQKIDRLIPTLRVNTFVSSSIYGIDYIARSFLTKNYPAVRSLGIGFQNGMSGLEEFCIYENHIMDHYLRSRLPIAVDSSHFVSRALHTATRYLDMMVVNNSPFSYSPTLEESNLSDHQKELLPIKDFFCYFSSSPDELGASASWRKLVAKHVKFVPDMFADELSAVQWAAAFANLHNLPLIIRLHPRLGKERRVPFDSEFKEIFVSQCKELSSRYSNIVVISPEDKISSYWIAYRAKLNLTYRSSLGSTLPLLQLATLNLSDNHGLSVPYASHAYLSHLVSPSGLLCPDTIKPTTESLILFIAGFYALNGNGFFPLNGTSALADDFCTDIIRRSFHLGSSVLGTQTTLRHSTDVQIIDKFIQSSDFSSYLAMIDRCRANHSQT